MVHHGIMAYHCIIMVSSYNYIIKSWYHHTIICLSVGPRLWLKSTGAKFQPLNVKDRNQNKITRCVFYPNVRAQIWIRGLNREEKWWLSDENRGLSGGHRWAQSSSHGCPRPPTTHQAPPRPDIGGCTLALDYYDLRTSYHCQLSGSLIG